MLLSTSNVLKITLGVMDTGVKWQARSLSQILVFSRVWSLVYRQQPIRQIEKSTFKRWLCDRRKTKELNRSDMVEWVSSPLPLVEDCHLLVLVSSRGICEECPLHNVIWGFLHPSQTSTPTTHFCRTHVTLHHSFPKTIGLFHLLVETGPHKLKLPTNKHWVLNSKRSFKEGVSQDSWKSQRKDLNRFLSSAHC